MMKTYAVRCDVPKCDSKHDEVEIKEHWASGWVSVHITSGQCAVVLCDVCPKHRDQVLELLGSFCEASFKSLCLPMPEVHRETRTSSASTIVAKVDALVDKIKRNLSYQVCVCIGTSRPHEDLDPPQGQTPTGPWKPFAASTFLLGEETNHRVFWSRPLVPEDTQAQASPSRPAPSRPAPSRPAPSRPAPSRPAPPSDYGDDEVGPIWTGGEAYVWCTYCTKNHAVDSGEAMCGSQRSWIRDPR